ncbi:hypothetical protein IMSAGC009_03115 [Lachnospiraceae bacterium]|nr:hypothetical protein IMSAGC009_03115 [Lachnospiraceae bacterium]
MFQFDSNLIQVELGNKAMQVFATKDTRGILDKLVGQAPPGWADDLIRATNQLKDKLEQEGIILPRVLFVPSPELPPKMFRITLGVAADDFDVYKDNYLAALEGKVRAYQIPNLTKESVGRLLNESLGYMLQKKFQEAMEVSMRVYYLGSQVEYSTARVASLLNMAGICLLNSKYEEAYTAARQAQLLVEKDGFYDPYLKFCVHKTIANVAALNKSYKDSAELFYQAYLDIEPSGDEQYIIDALYNEASVLMVMNSYKECTNVLDKIVSYIKNSDEYDKEILLKLYEMRAFIGDFTAEELGARLDDLKRNYDELSRSFLLKAQDTALTIVSKCGPCLITAFAGAVMGGDKYFTVSQNNVNGSNIIGVGVKVS